MNEFLDKAAAESKASKKEAEEKKRMVKSRKLIVQIMNGDFLSRDNFVKNLPFTFFIGFLLVVLIGWGYYAETVTKKEVNLERELGELNSEYFTLGSAFNSQRGRRTIAEKLKGTGVKEALTSPKKIKVNKYNFESGR